LWLYPETERRVSFVVCKKQQSSLFFQALYITKTTTKLTLPLVSGYNHNRQQNTLFFQSLDITKTNNLETERRVSFVVCFGYI
jgi:hypothetical protein